jgi:rubrerythrin
MSDLIRRDEVLRLAECGKLLSGFYGERAKDIIKAIPSVEERKEGKWVYGKDEETGEDDLYAWTCSECGGKYPWKPNFCPNCGAKMERRNE